MCGITGIYQPSGVKVLSKKLIYSMNDMQAHRGPDDKGYYLNEEICLGHTRLSIIDLTETGHQPISNEDKTLWLIFNGEIYNYIELREELKAKGHQFTGSSDSEVIVHLYEEYGNNCVFALRGMFAFALWDNRKKILFLARDRVGQKPLLYSIINGAFVFASTASPIIEYFNQTGVEVKISEDGLLCYLTRYLANFPLSMVNNIKRLAPATTLTIGQDMKPILKEYWSPFPISKIKIKELDAIDQFSNIFEESVKLMLRSDVPVGVLFSGGVDSSAILTTLSKVINKEKINVFSLGFPSLHGEDIELPYSSLLTSRINLNHFTPSFQTDAISIMPQLTQSYGEPIGSINYLYEAFLMQFIKSKNIKVVLSGDGADEVFGGYFGYNQVMILDQFKSLFKLLPVSLIENVSMKFFSNNSRVRDNIAKFLILLNLLKGSPSNLFNNYRGSTYRILPMVLHKRVVDSLLNSGMQYLYTMLETDSFFDAWLYFDLIYNNCNTTEAPDISSMASGVEVRTPFLDHKLIEFAFSLPNNLRVHNIFNQAYGNKYIIKKSFDRIIPKEILYRTKMGFSEGAMFDVYLRNEWKQFFLALLFDGHLETLNLFDMDVLNNIWEKHQSEDKNNFSLIWKIGMFGLWARTITNNKMI